MTPRFERRAPSVMHGAALVAEGRLAEDAVALLDARQPRLDALAWTAGNVARIDALLADRGAVLLRGFSPLPHRELATLVRTIAGDVIEYEYASTPRSRLGGGVYTSTEYPADQRIPLHNEMSYARRFPTRLAFYAETPAESGGRTPLADSAAVCRAVPEAVRERFRDRGVCYVRNYGGGLDLTWQSVFGTGDRSEVERYCDRAGISWQWLGDDRLRTWQVCPAIVPHPQSGADLWFNQSTLFHGSALDPELRARLAAAVGPGNLPRDCRYGDGAPIEERNLAAVRAAYDAETRTFAWRTSDILILDNMRIAHGREPFAGPRRLLVAMGGLAEVA